MSKLTKIALKSAFRDMLREKPFDKITVSALVKAAGVSHNTFYYNYDDIYALLDDFLRDEFAAQEKALREDERTADNWAAEIRALLRTCQDNSSIVYHLFNSLSRDRLERYVFTASDDAIYRYVCRQAEERDVSEERIADISNMCRYAATGCFLRFIWNNMSEDIDDLADKLSRMLTQYVQCALDAKP